MSLLPSSHKIITSAPQLPENKQPFSPDPQSPWGPRHHVAQSLPPRFGSIQHMVQEEIPFQDFQDGYLGRHVGYQNEIILAI